MDIVSIFIFFLFLSYLIQRTPIGQRNWGSYPDWVVRAARKSPPKVVDSKIFGELAWICRRTLGFSAGLTTVAFMDYITSDNPLFFGISATNWLSINVVLIGISLAFLPFAELPRNGPLAKWVSFFMGSSWAIAGIVLIVEQVIVRSLESQLSRTSFTRRFVTWSQLHPMQDIIAWSLSLIGLGVSILAAGESVPLWAGTNTPGRDDKYRRELNDSLNTDTVPQSPAKSPATKISKRPKQSSGPRLKKNKRRRVNRRKKRRT